MPSSNLAIVNETVALIAEARPREVVDVGVGHGKYGLLCREYAGGRLHRLVGIEGERRYITRFPWLAAIYDELIVADARDVDTRVYARSDLVLMLDVLEHFTEDDGAALIRRIPRPIIISTPSTFFQNPEADAGYETERHRSLWTRPMLEKLTGRKIVRDSVYVDTIGGILVRLDPT